MPVDVPARWVEQLPWDEVGRRLAAGAPALLPVGAGAKEHGLHLPMGTDQMQARWLAERLAGELDGLVWPTLAYGHYPAFTAYAGSLSLMPATFGAVVEEIVVGLLQHGAARVLVVDVGISSIPVIAAALARLPEADRRRVRHLTAYSGPRLDLARQRLSEQASRGGHADEIETSIMLALASSSVALGRVPERSGLGDTDEPGPLQPNEPHAVNYSPSGATGEPGLATVAKGEALLEAMLADLLAAARA
ncbi:MAG: creatininase family protein [Hyphomicrobiaceae bacterium]|nr:creatininase family protein [Hyphomicrobiaceae bacterium]